MPASLEIEFNYAAPYQHLNFKLVRVLTEKISVVGLLLEPSAEGFANTAIISVSKEGYQSAEPVVVDSNYYWDNLGDNEYIVELSFDLEPLSTWGEIYSATVPYIPILVAAVAAIFVGLLVLRRRRV